MANFEEHNGDVLNTVTMLERHLVKGGTFNSTSIPSIEQVEEVLAEAEGEMFAWLSEAGFSANIADYSIAAKRYLSWFAALGTAYRLELSHPGIQYNPSGNSRWMVLRAEYKTLKDITKTAALDRLGVTRSYEYLPTLTGISIDDKEVLTADSDKVQPFFQRDMMKNPARVYGSQIYQET